MKKEYQLIMSIVKKKYFVSTIWRKASTIVEMWYFETIVWEWDDATRERGQMLDMSDHGTSPEMAIGKHSNTCLKYYKEI